jgi:hypothetical protein
MRPASDVRSPERFNGLVVVDTSHSGFTGGRTNPQVARYIFNRQFNVAASRFELRLPHAFTIHTACATVYPRHIPSVICDVELRLERPCQPFAPFSEPCCMSHVFILLTRYDLLAGVSRLVP